MHIITFQRFNKLGRFRYTSRGYYYDEGPASLTVEGRLLARLAHLGLYNISYEEAIATAAAHGCDYVETHVYRLVTDRPVLHCVQQRGGLGPWEVYECTLPFRSCTPRDWPRTEEFVYLCVLTIPDRDELLSLNLSMVSYLQLYLGFARFALN